MPKRTQLLLGRGGCGFLVVSCLVACALLTINGLVVAAVWAVIEPLAPEPLQSDRFGQAVKFVCPVLLLAVQWWMWDRLVDRGRPTEDGA